MDKGNYVLVGKGHFMPGNPSELEIKLGTAHTVSGPLLAENGQMEESTHKKGHVGRLHGAVSAIGGVYLDPRVAALHDDLDPIASHGFTLDYATRIFDKYIESHREGNWRFADSKQAKHPALTYA